MSQVSGVRATSSETMRVNYMNLLITQLRHQNPLEPMSSEQMVAQLTQLSQLEQVERLNSTFERALESQQSNQAANLIGKPVSFFVQGLEEPYAGEVEGVSLVNGEVKVVVGDYVVDLEDIVAIGGGLDSTFNKLQLAEKMHEVSDVIGKRVSFIPDVDPNGNPFSFWTKPEAISGVVDSVEIDGSRISLVVGQYNVDFKDILSIENQ